MASADYAAALQALCRLALHGIQPGTERLATVLDRLGNPQAGIPAIHIAGTNGKGSTAAYCASLLGELARALQRAGGPRLRLGLYTSPHLQRVRERIQLSDEPEAGLRECTEAEFVRALAAVQEAAQAAPAVVLTFFEVLTAAAFVLWREAGVDLAVVETGLGGRLDATRLCAAAVTVVTSIDLDHVELLGPTRADIAREKAGIFKPGVPALAACADPQARAMLIAEAQRIGAPLRLYAAPPSEPTLLPAPYPAISPPRPCAEPPPGRPKGTAAASAAPTPGLTEPSQPSPSSPSSQPSPSSPSSPAEEALVVPPLDAELAAAVPLPGEHQLRNAALAVTAVQLFLAAPSGRQVVPGVDWGWLQALAHDRELLRAGLAATRWPGRLERLWPPVVAPSEPPPIAVPPGAAVWIDAAHNPEGVQALDRWLAAELGGRPLTLLFGAVAGKQVDQMGAPLRRAHKVVLTRPPSPRGLPPADLAAQLGALPGDSEDGSLQLAEDWLPALHAALRCTRPGGLLVIYGSIFLIAAVRGFFYGEEVDDLQVQDPGQPAAAQLSRQ